jgi:hypothetical protein
MLIEMGYPQHNETPIGEDNRACIFIATTANTSNMTKHMDIRLPFVRDAHQGNLVKIYYVPNDEMLVDIFTKPIANPQVEKVVLGVMCCLVE